MTRVNSLLVTHPAVVNIEMSATLDKLCVQTGVPWVFSRITSAISDLSHTGGEVHQKPLMYYLG